MRGIEISLGIPQQVLDLVGDTEYGANIRWTST